MACRTRERVDTLSSGNGKVDAQHSEEWGEKGEQMRKPYERLPEGKNSLKNNHFLPFSATDKMTPKPFRIENKKSELDVRGRRIDLYLPFQSLRVMWDLSLNIKS